MTIHAGRRTFIKTTAMAGIAATLPVAGRAGRGAVMPAAKPGTGPKHLLLLSNDPKNYEGWIATVQSAAGKNLRVSSLKVDYQKPDEIIRVLRTQQMDILLLCLPHRTFNFGSLYDAMGDLRAPVIVLSANPDLIPIDANLVASLRGNGANVRFALSRDQAADLVGIVAAPGILQDHRAVLFGKPFDSTTVPARNLTEDKVYRHTGVKMEYRPLAELASQYRSADETAARKEMQRWKKEATEVVNVPDETILDACRLYVYLRAMVEREGLSAVSMDCLGFTMSPDPILPYPCLAFARLRDDGITAACEADVCGMLTSMFLERASRKPSFMCNIMSLDASGSKILLSHCTSALKLNGPAAPPLKYRLHNYHNFGKGVVPEVAFPLGKEVLLGGFSKDLKSFAAWPGRIQTQLQDTEKTTAADGTPLNACANTMEVKIRDAGRFLQNINGLHQVMVFGDYTKTIGDALYGMNVSLVGPAEFNPPA
ncbi:MAG: hypothetical protein QM330_10405 [Acidobacteriota bacterium]|jgi:hypothetical protein|nr:hypothetical protein [Acidobacteriota bacterium]NLT32861.1 hypothetical protein [Acidobacteriota bacterium]